MPVIGFLNGRSADAPASYAAAFRKGLSEMGYVEGQNLTVEYHWLEGQYERVPPLVADLVRRRVAVAKAATTTIPIVFATASDPVALGLFARLNRPGGNVTGISSMGFAIGGKQLGILHELLPRAARFAVLVNPNSLDTESLISNMQAAAKT